MMPKNQSINEQEHAVAAASDANSVTSIQLSYEFFFQWYHHLILIILAAPQTAMEISHRVKQTRPQSNSKNYALFRLPLKAKDALGASLQVKMIFLVEVIVTQKTKTLIFHRVKIPAKQNTEAVLWRYSERKVFCTCIKFPGDRPCRFVISVKLPCNFIEIALLHGCFPVNLLHIFRTLEHLWWPASFNMKVYLGLPQHIRRSSLRH